LIGSKKTFKIRKNSIGENKVMINIAAAETENNLKPKLSVLGVGGAGCNAVNNMIDSGLEGIDFLVANTDSQSLTSSKAQRKIQLGINLTKGLGAGADPSVGKAAAEESLAEIVEALADSNMVFITAGAGGGTGSGACPVIAEALREKGVLTIGVMTKPFSFEGAQRSRVADMAIENMKRAVDTLLLIPNQNLFNIIDKNTTLTDAFNLADEVLFSAVSSITDLIVKEGRMNRDFADIKEIVSKKGEAMMGTGEGSGEERAIEAAEKAISNPLLDNVSIKGATGVLLNITGSKDITLFEVDDITNRVRKEIESGDDEAEFIIGTTIDESMGDKIKVSIVATGITDEIKSDLEKESKIDSTEETITVARPFMDDGEEDITEISTEEVISVANEKEEDDDLVVPVSLFSAMHEEEEIEEEAGVKEEDNTKEPLIRISEDGSVIRPLEKKVVVEEKKAETTIKAEKPTTSEKHEKEGSFFGRIMKSKEKIEKEIKDDFQSSNESFSDDVDLPDFLSRK